MAKNSNKNASPDTTFATLAAMVAVLGGLAIIVESVAFKVLIVIGEILLAGIIGYRLGKLKK